MSQSEVNDIDPKQVFLKNKTGKDSLDQLVASGALDEFLPPDMRPSSARFDETESVEYIKEKVRNKDYITFDAEMEIRQIGSTIEELTSQINKELEINDVNRLIQETIDQQNKADAEARSVESIRETASVAERGGEAITAPTKGEVTAKQEREAQAQKLDEQEQIRKESEAGAGQFRLEAQEGRQDTTGNLFSQAPAPTEASSKAATTKAVKESFGIGSLAAMPSVDVVNSSELKGDIDPKAQAYYNPATKRVVLIADRIQKGREVGVLLHETLHKNEEALTKEQLQQLEERVSGWKDAPEGSVEKAIFEAANERAEATSAKGEFLAYAIEEAVNRGVKPTAGSDAKASGWLNKVKEFFTDALKKLNPQYKGKLTPQDLVDIAYGMAGLELSGQGMTPTGDIRYSLTPDQAAQKQVDKALAQEKKQDFTAVANTAFKRRVLDYVDRYMPMKDWINSFKGVSDAAKQRLDTAISQIGSIKTNQEATSTELVRDAVEFAASQETIKPLTKEQKAGAFSTWAQMSTVEDATKKLLDKVLDRLTESRQARAGKGYTKQEQLDALTAAFVEAANNENSFNPKVGSVKNPALINFLEEISEQKFSDIKDVDFNKFGLVRFEASEYMRLPMGLTVKAAKTAMTNIEKDLGVKPEVFEQFYQQLNAVVDKSNRQAIEDGRLDQATYNEWKKTRYLPAYAETTVDPSLALYDGYQMAHSSAMLRIPKDYELTGYSVADPDSIVSPQAAITNVLQFAKAQAQASASNRFLEQLYDIHLDDVNGKPFVKSSMGMAMRPMTSDTGGKRLQANEYVVYLPSRTGKVVPFALTLPENISQNLAAKEEDPPIYAPMTRAFGRGVTRYMLPAFQLGNALIADVFDRMTYLQLNNAVGLTDSKGNQVKINALNATTRFFREGLLRPIANKNAIAAGWKLESGELVKKDPKSMNEEERDLYYLSKNGYLQTLGDVVRLRNKDANEVTKDLLGGSGIGGALKATDRKVEQFNAAFEAFAPLVMFRATKKELISKGFSEEDAARAAGGLVLQSFDVKRSGLSSASVAGSYLFFIPGMTSAKNILKAAKTSPVRASVVLGMNMAFAYALYAMATGGDEEEYKDGLGNSVDRKPLTQAISYIPLGKDYQMPVPFGLPRLAWGLTVISERVRKGFIEAGDATLEAMNVLLKTFSPISPSEVSASENPIFYVFDTITPTIFKGALYAGADKTTRGQNIRRNDYGLAYLSGKAGTPEQYKEASEWLYEKTGVQAYPEQLQTMFEYYMVGPLQMIPNSWKQEQKLLQGKATGEKDNPFARYAFGRFLQAEEGTSAVDARYYKIINEYTAVKQSKFDWNEKAKDFTAKKEFEPWEYKAAHLSRYADQLRKDKGGKDGKPSATYLAAHYQNPKTLEKLTDQQKARVKELMPQWIEASNMERLWVIETAKKIEDLRRGR